MTSGIDPHDPNSQSDATRRHDTHDRCNALSAYNTVSPQDRLNPNNRKSLDQLVARRVTKEWGRNYFPISANSSAGTRSRPVRESIDIPNRTLARSG